MCSDLVVVRSDEAVDLAIGRGRGVGGAQSSREGAARVPITGQSLLVQVDVEGGAKLNRSHNKRDSSMGTINTFQSMSLFFFFYTIMFLLHFGAILRTNNQNEEDKMAICTHNISHLLQEVSCVPEVLPGLLVGPLVSAALLEVDASQVVV